MKVVEKISLVIFSIIILAISLTTCFIISGWLEISVISDLIEKVLTNQTGGITLLVVSTILAILSVICIFSAPSTKENSKEGILLENENGKLLVSKYTIESLANSVIKNFDSIENSNTRVEVDRENKISIFITLSVYSEAVIKDLAANIQENIKEEVKKSLDLEIKEVNIRVKSINSKKENIVKE